MLKILSVPKECLYLHSKIKQSTMKTNLICLFSKDNFTKREVNLFKALGDNFVYAKAQLNIVVGAADIYTPSDFATDFNDNANSYKVSSEVWYAMPIWVDEGEVAKWEK